MAILRHSNHHHCEEIMNIIHSKFCITGVITRSGNHRQLLWFIVGVEFPSCQVALRPLENDKHLPFKTQHWRETQKETWFWTPDYLIIWLRLCNLRLKTILNAWKSRQGLKKTFLSHRHRRPVKLLKDHQLLKVVEISIHSKFLKFLS